ASFVVDDGESRDRGRDREREARPQSQLGVIAEVSDSRLSSTLPSPELNRSPSLPSMPSSASAASTPSQAFSATSPASIGRKGKARGKGLPLQAPLSGAPVPPDTVTVLAVTWNMGNRRPKSQAAIEGLLQAENVDWRECSLISIALQESGFTKDAWHKRIHSVLSPTHVKCAIGHVTGGGVVLSVYAKLSVAPYITCVQHRSLTAGPAGLPNKGSTSVSLCVCGTSFAFVGCHLPAHQAKVYERTKTLALVFYHTGLAECPHQSHGHMDRPLQHRFDRVFLQGDLNFRVDGTRPSVDSLLACQPPMLGALLANDQLLKALKAVSSQRHHTISPFPLSPQGMYTSAQPKRPKGDTDSDTTYSRRGANGRISSPPGRREGERGGERERVSSPAEVNSSLVKRGAKQGERGRERGRSKDDPHRLPSLPHYPYTDTDTLGDTPITPRLRPAATSVLSCLKEAPITFLPTYKLERHSDLYDRSDKQRIPGWTDRILYTYREHSKGIPQLRHGTPTPSPALPRRRRPNLIAYRCPVCRNRVAIDSLERLPPRLDESDRTDGSDSTRCVTPRDNCDKTQAESGVVSMEGEDTTTPIVPVVYTSQTSIRYSDHRPVMGLYRVTLLPWGIHTPLVPPCCAQHAWEGMPQATVVGDNPFHKNFFCC
ncbi:hypothetical protein KIPB_006510, partial [Kipferlia bialata]